MSEWEQLWKYTVRKHENAVIRARRKAPQSTVSSNSAIPEPGIRNKVSPWYYSYPCRDPGQICSEEWQGMWKKQDDAEDAQPQSSSEPHRDARRLLEEALSASLSINDDFQKRNVVVPSEKVLAESNQPLDPPTMNTYTEAVKEFTANATAFLEHLPLLTKARSAYEEAMRASTEMRKVLDSSDENLRALMTQLEQQVNFRELKAATDKKQPEPAKVERMKATDEGGGRAFKWP
jgi:hypothetical protein